jgi:hypothetical protein
MLGKQSRRKRRWFRGTFKNTEGAASHVILRSYLGELTWNSGDPAPWPWLPFQPGLVASPLPLAFFFVVCFQTWTRQPFLSKLRYDCPSSSHIPSVLYTLDKPHTLLSLISSTNI